MSERGSHPFNQLAAALEDLRSRSGRWAGSFDAGLVLSVCLAATTIAMLSGLTTPVRFLEDLTYDLRVSLLAPPNTVPMAIVKIDDDALDVMQKSFPCHCLSPIDKTWLAELISELSAKGARVIAIDTMMDDFRSPEEVAAFSQAVAKSKAPIVAVVDPSHPRSLTNPVIPKLSYADARALVSDDYDNVIRRYDPKSGQLPALAAAVAEILGTTPPTRTFSIRYRRPPSDLSDEDRGAIAPSYSAAYLEFVPADKIQGRLVFVGAVTRSPGTYAQMIPQDLHMTPLRFLPGHYLGTPGVEIHANAVSQMITGDGLKTPGWLWSFGIVLFGAMAGALLGRATLSWWVSAGIALGAFLLSGINAFAVYKIFALMTPMTTPAIAFAMAFFVLSRLAAERLKNERAFYSTTLARYLSPQVIERIVAGSEPVSIGAQERDITVLVTDLANFSGLVANTPIQRLSQVINDYFDGLTEVLWRHEGLIDKMTGDGVIAVFGAPVVQSDHAQRALSCARDIALFSETFRAAMAKMGVSFGVTRVGLSSGTGLVGNFGGGRRFNYTAYGQVVVLAARLEAANKEFGTEILFSEATLKQAGEVADAHALGEAHLKGVDDAILVFTLKAPPAKAAAS